MLSEIIISGVIKVLDGILYRLDMDSSNRTSKSKAGYRICNTSFNVTSAVLVTCMKGKKHM